MIHLLLGKETGGTQAKNLSFNRVYGTFQYKGEAFFMPLFCVCKNLVRNKRKKEKTRQVFPVLKMQLQG